MATYHDDAAARRSDLVTASRIFWVNHAQRTAITQIQITAGAVKKVTTNHSDTAPLFFVGNRHPGHWPWLGSTVSRIAMVMR